MADDLAARCRHRARVRVASGSFYGGAVDAALLTEAADWIDAAEAVLRLARHYFPVDASDAASAWEYNDDEERDDMATEEKA